MSDHRLPPSQARSATMMNHFAAFLAALRASCGNTAWDTAGITAALDKAKPMASPADLAVAAIRAAVDPGNRTPAVIGMAGPHWSAPPRTPRPPAPVSVLPDPADVADPAVVAAALAHIRKTILEGTNRD
jgi:hypothetical protein